MKIPELEDYQDLLSSIDDSNSGEVFGVLNARTKLPVAVVMLGND